MKKVVLLFALMLAIFAIPKSVYASSNVVDNQVNRFIAECSAVIPEWNNATSVRGESLYGINDEKVGVIFRVFEHNEQHGYVLYLNDIGITEATWKGTDRAAFINGKVYYVTPGMFFDRKGFMEYLENRVEEEIIYTDKLYSTTYHIFLYNSTYYISTLSNFTLDTSRIPNLTANVTYVSGPYSVRYDIEDTPDYLSIVGCSPTAGAMLVGYYDNEMWDYLSSYDGSGAFPLSYNHTNYTNYTSSQSLINLLASSTYMNTDSSGGTSIGDLMYGLEKYFALHSLSTYKVYTGSFSTSDPNFPVTSIPNYELLIRRGNPSIINMYGHPTYSNHSVLGMGYLYAASWGTGAIIHDGFGPYDWDGNGTLDSDETDIVEVLITYSVLSNYGYIYND